MESRNTTSWFITRIYYQTLFNWVESDVIIMCQLRALSFKCHSDWFQLLRSRISPHWLVVSSMILPSMCRNYCRVFCKRCRATTYWITAAKCAEIFWEWVLIFTLLGNVGGINTKLNLCEIFCSHFFMSPGACSTSTLTFLNIDTFVNVFCCLNLHPALRHVYPW